MSDVRSDREAVEDWPTFALRYTFNPGAIGLDREFASDEVIVFDATRGRPTQRWVAAERDSYLPLTDVR